VPSKDPAIVRRRSRGSLPRLHLRLFSSSSKCSLFESSRRSKVTVRPLHKDQAPSLTPRQVSFDCPKNASRLLQTLNVRHPNPVPIATGSHIAFVKGSAGRHPPTPRRRSIRSPRVEATAHERPEHYPARGSFCGDRNEIKKPGLGDNQGRGAPVHGDQSGISLRAEVCRARVKTA
jgi:hypothetical protein